MGDFALSGAELRAKGLNRIGNLLIPNENYVKLEQWMMPILDQMVLEQKEQVNIKRYTESEREKHLNLSICIGCFVESIPDDCAFGEGDQ